MASAEEYVGLRFGEFVIERQLGAGAEAEVFLVLHETTGRRHVLRLDANDDDLWRGKPLTPPKNRSIERDNVRGSYFAAIKYHEMGADRRKTKSSWWPFGSKSEDQWVISVPTIYAVSQARYLIPVSTPLRVKTAIHVGELESIAPSDDLHLFELWEDIVLTMLGEADLTNSGSMSEQDWSKRWSQLVGGRILTGAMSRYMEGGALSASRKAAVLKRISSPPPARQLAENIILRLCGCVSRGRLSLKAAKATLRWECFRVNLTLVEINQMLACGQILQNSLGSAASLGLLSELLECLEHQPFELADESTQFGYSSGQEPNEEFEQFFITHNIDQHEIFLQTYAANQPFVTLESNK